MYYKYLKRLGRIEVDWWCTNAWKAFVYIENKFTKAIEWVNTALINSL